MRIERHKVCTIEGCGRASHGKALCGTHLKGQKLQPTITPATQKSMRSMCCTAPCTMGEQHDYGKQYCNKCKKPCLWKP